MTIRIATTIAVLFLAIVSTHPAHAEAKTGWGISAGIGVSQIKDVDGSDEFEGSAFGLSLEGEYRFTPHFALGIGVFNLGRTDDEFGSVDTEIRVRGATLFGRAIYPASDTVDLYARVGGASYYADIDPGVGNLFGEDAIEFGLGIDIGGGNRASFRIEGRYFNGARDESGALATIGVSYRF